MSEQPALNEMPKHVAIIMDGNGRWAKRQGLMRIKGHAEGVKRTEEIIRAADDLGLQHLTLYAFSKENWKRPKLEVDFLMTLFSGKLDEKIKELHEKKVVMNILGDKHDLPGSVRKKFEAAMELTKNNTGLRLHLALSYSSREELVRASRLIAEKAAQGALDPKAIDEKVFSDHLYTAGIPDPELLIRTSGEIRVSNFLLWQISYAEIYVTPKFWPEFTKEEFQKAIDDYRKRERRFGRTEAVKGEKK